MTSLHRSLRIAVASGKGGTGKTTIATSLALSLREIPEADESRLADCQYLDCDVEAPNAHLFLHPNIDRRQEVVIPIPEVDPGRCSTCGRCAEVCQYHAIVVLGKKTLVFPQLCHGCGSCTLICPEGAITEIPHVIGIMESGAARSGISFARGVLNIGEPMATPAIRQLKHWARPASQSSNDTGASVVILDAPPGTSCPVVETIRGADYLLLVTEPTPFGLHDLRLAVDVARELGIPSGVIINRDGIGDAAVDDFCASARLPILLRIPYERAVAEGIARGTTLLDSHPELAPRFREMLNEIRRQVGGAT